jgi:hypothetical protein
MILMTIPHLFLKVKIKEEFVNDNDEIRLDVDEQDYFRDSYNNCDKFFIHNSILIEDLFINEKSDIDKKYDKFKEID